MLWTNAYVYVRSAYDVGRDRIENTNVVGLMCTVKLWGMPLAGYEA